MPYAILSTALPAKRMGVYMGVFNFFIVIPEIIASLGFGPLIRVLFGRDNPNAPLYVVMLGGLCLLVAAVCVGLVREVVVRDVSEEDVLRADAHERFVLPESAQPVPSTGPMK
jgi:maltose/moltooligosaccharide transporter